MCCDDGRRRRVHDVPESRIGNVRNVDHHPQPVHLAHDVLSQTHSARASRQHRHLKIPPSSYSRSTPVTCIEPQDRSNAAHFPTGHQSHNHLQTHQSSYLPFTGRATNHRGEVASNHVSGCCSASARTPRSDRQPASSPSRHHRQTTAARPRSKKLRVKTARLRAHRVKVAVAELLLNIDVFVKQTLRRVDVHIDRDGPLCIEVDRTFQSVLLSFDCFDSFFCRTAGINVEQNSK